MIPDDEGYRCLVGYAWDAEVGLAHPVFLDAQYPGKHFELSIGSAGQPACCSGCPISFTGISPVPQHSTGQAARLAIIVPGVDWLNGESWAVLLPRGIVLKGFALTVL